MIRAQQSEPLPYAELMNRLEAAGPEDAQELSAEIARFVGTWELVSGRFPSYPPYCTSLDAALTLVPERLMLSLKHGWTPGPWLVHIDIIHGAQIKWIADAVSPTGPLALCIAALKALQASR